MNLDLLSRLSSVLVSIDGGPTWAWVVLAVALSAVVLWHEHADRKRVGSIYPSVDDCMVAAERRGMTVPAWDPPTEDRPSWRVVFARRDGTALLLTESWFGDDLSADVYPTAELALAASWDVPPAGYGSIPYALGWRWLNALLDRFRDWDGGDLVGALTDRLPSGPGGSRP